MEALVILAIQAVSLLQSNVCFLLHVLFIYDLFLFSPASAADSKSDKLGTNFNHTNQRTSNKLHALIKTKYI